MAFLNTSPNVDLQARVKPRQILSQPMCQNSLIASAGQTLASEKNLGSTTSLRFSQLEGRPKCHVRNRSSQSCFQGYTVM